MQGTFVLVYDDEEKKVEPLLIGAFKDDKRLLYEVLRLFLDQVIIYPALEKERAGHGDGG